MRARAFLVAVSMGAMLTSTARAEEGSVPLRSFERFELDTGVAKGLWAEIGTKYFSDGADLDLFGANADTGGIDVDTVTTFGRFAYGIENFEAGVVVPYHFASVEGARNDEDGFGDVRTYGKVVPVQTRLLDLGLGFDFRFPSGDEEEGLSVGDVGFLPFATGALHFGIVDLRGHLGYRFWNDTTRDKLPESWMYGGGVHVLVSDMVALRAELLAETIDVPGDDLDIELFETGADVRIPLTGMDLIIRPNVTAGLNDESADWGVGGSVALALNP